MMKLKIASLLCAEFNADFDTVVFFLLALIVFDSYSFENLKKKKHKKLIIIIFLKNHTEIQKNFKN